MYLARFVPIATGLLFVTCCSSAFASASWQQYINELLSENKGPAFNQYNLTPEQIKTLKDLDVEQNRLDTIITMGLRNGRLSADQGSTFRGELNRIADLQSAAVSDNQLTYPEAKQLVELVNTLDQNLVMSYKSGVPSQKFSDSIPYNLYEQDKERDRILNLLIEARNSGLAESDYLCLRARIDVFTQQMDGMRLKKGYLSLSDRQILNAELKDLNEIICAGINAKAHTVSGAF